MNTKMRSRHNRTITVRELIDALELEDENALVIFSADYGDYSHTQQALFIEGTTEEVTIHESAYSRTGFAIDENDEAEDASVLEQTYLLLK